MLKFYCYYDFRHWVLVWISGNFIENIHALRPLFSTRLLFFIYILFREKNIFSSGPIALLSLSFTAVTCPLISPNTHWRRNFYNLLLLNPARKIFCIIMTNITILPPGTQISRKRNEKMCTLQLCNHYCKRKAEK